MSISFACDQCRKRYTVDESLAGKRVKCKGCGASLTIPAAARPVVEDEVDPYDFGEATASPGAGAGERLIPRGGAGRQPARAGVPPWVWLAGGGASLVVVAVVLAIAFSSGPGRPQAAKEGAVPDTAAANDQGNDAPAAAPSKPRGSDTRFPARQYFGSRVYTHLAGRARPFARASRVPGHTQADDPRPRVLRQRLYRLSDHSQPICHAGRQRER